MKWLTNGVVVAAVALLGVACAERVSSPEVATDQRAALMQRIKGLKSQVAPNGRLTTAQLKMVEQLRQDVIAYQARTGRQDLTVTGSNARKAPVDASLAVRGVTPNPAPSTCNCQAVTYTNGSICFLISASCEPGDLQYCWNLCFGTGPAGPPTK